jgi:nucleotide-binding universal stress UspA family protein
MPRYLVVANQTLGGERLMEEIRSRIAAGSSSFHVLVPFAPIDFRPGLAAMGNTRLTAAGYAGQVDRASEGAADRAERSAQLRLNELLSQIRAAGSEAEGEVGVSDPVKAIDAAMSKGGFDEIIISTLPEGISRWLRMDVPHRVQRKFSVPVTTVTARE